MNIQEILLGIGITKQESRTYLALLKLKEARTGILSDVANIASSHIYSILKSLINKGLVSYRMQNNRKIFMPSSPEVINELFRKKQDSIENEKKQVVKAISELKILNSEETPYSHYKYYEGISGIKGMWYEINSGLSKDTEERIFAGKKESYERMLGFYDEHHKLKNKLKVNTKILVSKDGYKEIAKKRKNKNTEVKFEELDGRAEWGIIGDMVYIQQIVTKNLRGFLIKDKIFADAFKEVFDKIWEKSKG